MILDTNILIALEREVRRKEDGPVSAWMAEARGIRYQVTPTIAGEMACGISPAEQAAWVTFLQPFEMLPIDDRVAWQYGQLYRDLAARGELIGANDLWIAAAALVHGESVLTRNTGEFRRVSGLRVVALE